MYKDNFWKPPGSLFCSVTHLCKPFRGLPLLPGLKPKAWTHLQGLVSSDLCLPWLARCPRALCNPPLWPSLRDYSPLPTTLLQVNSYSYSKSQVNSASSSRHFRFHLMGLALCPMLSQHGMLLSSSLFLNPNEVLITNYIIIYTLCNGCPSHQWPPLFYL